MLKLPHITLISHGSKVMLKILQDRLQQYVNKNFQMFKLDLEKAEDMNPPQVYMRSPKPIQYYKLKKVKIKS